MAAGIQGADNSIEHGVPVWIRDELHGRPLAIGWSLMGGDEMRNSQRGKAIQTVHWVGDELGAWTLVEKSRSENSSIHSQWQPERDMRALVVLLLIFIFSPVSGEQGVQTSMLIYLKLPYCR